MRNYVSGSCMSEHNMRKMKIECMQLAEQKHAKMKMYDNAMPYENIMHEYDKWRNDMSITMPWRDAWYDQGTSQSEFAMCPLIHEPNGKDPKVHF